MPPKLSELLPDKFTETDINQNAKAHLIEVDNYIEHHEYDTDADKIKAFKRAVTGDALIWTTELKPTTYAGLKEEFLKRYGKNTSRDSIFNTLNNLKYKTGSPIAALVHQIRELCGELEINNDKDMFDYFKRALPLEMKKFVLSSGPTTMKDAAAKAQTYIDIASNEKEVTFCTEFSSITLTDETTEPERGKNKKLLCLYCGQKHNYRDCPLLESDIVNDRLGRKYHDPTPVHKDREYRRSAYHEHGHWRSDGRAHSRSPSRGRSPSPFRYKRQDRSYSRGRGYDRNRGQQYRGYRGQQYRGYRRQQYSGYRGQQYRGFRDRGRAPSRGRQWNNNWTHMCMCSTSQARQPDVKAECCFHRGQQMCNQDFQ